MMSLDMQNLRKNAEATLYKHWGHRSFRTGQWEAIEALLCGRDVLTVLPTGGGKSVCYQIPPLIQGGVTLVITPLISLMQDQVAGLNVRRIHATFINSDLSTREIDRRLTDTEFGRYRVVYIAPERLRSEIFQQRAGRLGITLLAVDEAHCISEWGIHFRPAYLDIAEARVRIGNPPMIALTATATPYVRRDILENLRMQSPLVIIRDFDRPNIVWSVLQPEDKLQKVRELIHQIDGSGIVYTATRRASEYWAERLVADGVRASAYHGGLRGDIRASIQNSWIKGELRVITATNAFGMGIDKPDVRFVIHVDLSASLEGYYQEAGRAGRDGASSHALLLYRPEDELIRRELLEQSHPGSRTVRQVYDTVCSLGGIPFGGFPDSPVTIDLELLSKVTELSKGKVQNAIEILNRQETWQVVPERRHHALIHITQPVDGVRQFALNQKNGALAGFINELMRTVHGEAYIGWWELDLRILEKRMKLPRERIAMGLKFLQERDLLKWLPPGGVLRLVLNHPRAQSLPVDDQTVRRAKRRAEIRLEDMLRYARSVTCRRQFLLDYFGNEHIRPCGKCDVCLSDNKAAFLTPVNEPLLRELLQQINQKIPRDEWKVTATPGVLPVASLLAYLEQEAYVKVRRFEQDEFELTEKGYEFLRQWRPREN